MTLDNQDCKDVWAPFGLSMTTSVITILLTVITLPGNLLICIAMYKDPHKELRTTFNYLLLNVAVSDLLIGAITDPLFVFFHMREALDHSLATWYPVHHMSLFIGGTASLLSIAMLTVERSISVGSNFHRKIPKSRVTKMSIAIWLFSLGFPFTYFATGFLRMTFVFSILMICVTFAIIMTSFIRIHGSIRRMKDSKVQDQGGVNHQNTQLQRKHAEYERRVTGIFKSILIFYAACNIPALVFMFIANFCSTCNCQLIHWSRDIFNLCVLVNCGGNQFLYAWRMRCFTRTFSALFRKSALDTQNNQGEEYKGTSGSSRPAIE